MTETKKTIHRSNKIEAVNDMPSGVTEKVMKAEKLSADDKWMLPGVLGMIILAVAFIIGFIRAT